MVDTDLPTLDELEHRYLVHVLKAVGGNRSQRVKLNEQQAVGLNQSITVGVNRATQVGVMAEAVAHAGVYATDATRVPVPHIRADI